MHAKLVQLNLQGQWTRRCDYMTLDLSWNNLLAMSHHLSSFYLGATYNTRPSPSNLYRWYNVPEAVFPLSTTRLHITHIFEACRVALQQGRFTFFLSSIKGFLTLYHDSKTKFWYIKFVLSNQKPPKEPTADCYIVHQNAFFLADWHK